MKLKGSLPKEELNGLDKISQVMIRKPAQKHIIIGVIDAATVIEYPAHEATAQLLRVEAVPPEMEAQFADLLEKIFEQRTGKTSLDMGIPDEFDLRTQFAKQAESTLRWLTRSLPSRRTREIRSRMPQTKQRWTPARSRLHVTPRSTLPHLPHR